MSNKFIKKLEADGLKVFISDVCKKTMLVLLLTTWSAMSFAQTTIKGKVTDAEDGSGIPGVSILEKGTGNGTISDIEGNYTLSVGEGSVVIYSYIGYKAQEIMVGARSVVDVALAVDVEVLGEVVVVGYGAVEKRDVTGSIASIDTKEFNQGIITSPEGLLAGKVAGVQITSNGGEPGGGSFIRIRGATSINADSSPLIVIDGVAMGGGGVAGGRNPLNFINPADIENITVLKDASATAIYGSRAANGVIIVTTKQGQAGKIKVSYDAFYSVSSFTGNSGELSPANFRAAIDLKLPQENAFLGDANTNWVDEVTRPAIGLRQMLSVSGGSENHRLYTSVNYLKNQGVLNTSSNENFNLSLKYNGKFFNDNLKVNINTKYGSTRDRFAPNVMGAAITYDPTRPVRDDNPDTGGYYQWPIALAPRNPVAVIDLIDNTGKTDRLLGNIELEYNIPFIKGLSVKTNISKDVNNGENQNLNPQILNTYTSAAADSGNYSNYAETRTSRLLEVYGMYKKDISAIDSKLDILVGYSWQDFIFNQSKALQVFKLGDNFDRNNPLDGTTVRPTRLGYSENRLISFFGRVNFHVKDKYLMTVNLRRDGSTKFSPSNRWGLFPSVALGWRILDEDFAMPLKNVLSDLKFRFGYGVIGNQGINDYLYLSLYRYGLDNASYQFGDEFVNTLRPNSVDPLIRWEQTQTTNIGIDFGIGTGRVNGSIDLYRKYTTDMLFDVVFAVGLLTGDRAVTNVGEMENRGIELLLNATIIDKKDFSLTASYNIALNRNTIRKLDNSVLPDSIQTRYPRGGISGDVGQEIQTLQVGNPVNAFSTYRQKYGEGGFPIYSENKLEMYQDINGDGIINELDRGTFRSPDPKLMMGLTVNMNYKNFDMAMTFRSQLGNYVYNNVSSASGSFEGLKQQVTQNINKSAFDTNFATRELISDYYLEDASFVKLDNISFGYSKALKPINLRVYTTLQNVFVLTKYSGIDPEISSGIDNNLYPRSLTLLFGINISY